MRKELRGAEALRYSVEEGILFDIDEGFLLEAAGRALGRIATREDIHQLFKVKLGRRYDPTNILPGEESFNLLVECYSDGWICVPLEGNHPEEEEQIVLNLLHRQLGEKEPACGGDILSLVCEYAPEIRDSGFPSWATTNLLYHAALRLVECGQLLADIDMIPRKEDVGQSYGKRQFFLPPDGTVSLSGVLCPTCWDEVQQSNPALHRDCAERLREALAKFVSRPKAV